MSETSNPRVKLKTSQGDLLVELWPDVAPGHAENFLKLTREKFFDGLSFHRILPGFVIQGGCPRGDGTGGPGYRIKAEFNDRRHDVGVLSMARSSDPDSAGSQFFICLSREGCEHLDGQYTAFGRVVEGLDVVKRLGETPLADARSGTPVEPPIIELATAVE